MVFPPAPGFRPLWTSWGVPVLADPTKTIGHSILTTGLFDLAVSEALARLIDPRDTVVDAGANVGYMSLLAAAVAGPGGRVLSFEPHPDLFAVLKQNFAAVDSEPSFARAELHQSALGERQGSADLILPADLDVNDGVARIATGTSNDRSIPVAINTLDAVLGNDSAAVMKMDVEGYELQVLLGASKALAARRIRHILFEDHQVGNSPVVRSLQEANYSVFALGWSMRGPVLSPVEAGSLASSYEAPSFIATVNPEQLLARFRPRGWNVLRRLPRY